MQLYIRWSYGAKGGCKPLQRVLHTCRQDEKYETNLRSCSSKHLMTPGFRKHPQSRTEQQRKDHNQNKFQLGMPCHEK